MLDRTLAEARVRRRPERLTVTTFDEPKRKRAAGPSR